MADNNFNGIIDSFAIFNPTLNEKNSENLEEEKKEIIYYYPQNVPLLDQIKDIGLAKAIIKFTNTFQLKDTNSNIHSLRFRQVLIQPEKNFWISMKINLEKFQLFRNSLGGQENTEYINKQLNDTYLESKLNILYLKFKIFNNSFNNIMKNDSVESLREKAKIYFDVCIPYLKFDTIDILSTITGLNMISLNKEIELEIEDLIDKVHKNFQFTSGSLIFWKNNVIYNDMDFDYLKDMTVLYDFLIDPYSSEMQFTKINPLQNNKPIIKASSFSTNSTQTQVISQNKNTSIFQSIKILNPFSSREANQNTGFLTGPLSLNNNNISTTPTLPISSKNNSSNSSISNHNINNINNNGNNEKIDENIEKILNGNFIIDPVIDNLGDEENNDIISLPQIVYLGDHCEPYYLIIYKYLEEITALFFIKVNTQEFEDTYISLSKLSKSKDTITSFDSINSKEDYVNYIEEKLKGDEFYYSLEAVIRPDFDDLLEEIQPIVESQNNIIDDQYKYIIFKHSKMLVKTSKGYLKTPGLIKTISQYILDLYDDIERKQDCTELCIRSSNSIWIGIKRIEQCDYILILPKSGFKELTEIDDEFNKVIASFQQQQHDSQ